MTISEVPFLSGQVPALRLCHYSWQHLHKAGSAAYACTSLRNLAPHCGSSAGAEIADGLCWLAARVALAEMCLHLHISGSVCMAVHRAFTGALGLAMVLACRAQPAMVVP